MRTRRVLVLAACMVFLTAGLAQAATLDIGGTFSQPIYMYNTSTNTHLTEGGGSVETSYLDGSQLRYLYCVDIATLVYVPGSYAATDVNTNGYIYGNYLNNATEVAWLLTQYGVAGQGDNAKALQASIWSVVSDTGSGATIVMDSAAGYATAEQLALYNQYLGSIPDTIDQSIVSNFNWITPGRLDSNGNVVAYQGLVAPVPIPGAAWLLGSGLIGLIGLKRRSGRKA